MQLGKKLLSVAATLAMSAGLAVVPASPAFAYNYSCRSAYTAGGWYAYPCIETDGSYFRADATVLDAPTNCTHYRVYVLDNWGDEVYSTSARDCSETQSPQTAALYFSLAGHYAQARLKAWNGTTQILSIDSPKIYYLL
ncbi:hypothetical protein [Micromonospora echinospora]|uniref:hypothetical protein n=1 Tax=Micromonospora echinospora TaxID=1877 RepID=UPI003671A2EC